MSHLHRCSGHWVKECEGHWLFQDCTSGMAKYVPFNIDRVWAVEVNHTLALWLVPFITLVFGLETAVRSFKKPKFPRQGKWNVPICFLAVALLLLVVWVPSKIQPAHDRCLADLMSWTSHYAMLGAVVLSAILVILIAIAVVIFLQLVKNVKIEPNERIAATRAVAYIVLVVILMV